MNILHVATLNSENFGGPNINVPKNVYYGNYTDNCALYNCGNIQKFESLPDEKVFLSSKYNSIVKLPSPFNKPDIVVFQSMYEPKFIKVAIELRKTNIPYIVVPRGALTEKAQHKKRIKKILGNLAFFKKFIKNALAIQFLTENEYLESEKVFSFKKHIIVGNGVDEKSITKRIDVDKKDFIVSFIGRIELYHKGLDYLIEAINIGKKEFAQKKFVFKIYGINESNSVEKLNKLIEFHGISNIVKIYPPVYGKNKEKAFLESDLFIHTSRLEGQPTAVMEAISYGIPVFVTPGTNVIDIVKKNDLGFVSEFDIGDIKNNLILAFENRKRFKEISKNEIEFCKKNSNSKTIIAKTISEYKKILRDDSNDTKGKNN